MSKDTSISVLTLLKLTNSKFPMSFGISFEDKIFFKNCFTKKTRIYDMKKYLYYLKETSLFKALNANLLLVS